MPKKVGGTGGPVSPVSTTRTNEAKKKRFAKLKTQARTVGSGIKARIAKLKSGEVTAKKITINVPDQARDPVRSQVETYLKGIRERLGEDAFVEALGCYNGSGEQRLSDGGLIFRNFNKDSTEQYLSFDHLSEGLTNLAVDEFAGSDESAESFISDFENYLEKLSEVKASGADLEKQKTQAPEQTSRKVNVAARARTGLLQHFDGSRRARVVFSPMSHEQLAEALEKTRKTPDTTLSVRQS